MTLVHADRIYTGRIIHLDRDTVRFPDGSTGQLEMIRHPGAAAVVPLLDPLDHPDPRVVLLHQFRHATDGVLWEIPAGRLDPGENPEQCARRELKEEAGYTAAAVTPLTSIWTTPGFTDEKIHLFVATGLEAGEHAREADEFMEVHPRPWSEVMAMVSRGEITDGKTLCALLFVHGFRLKA